MNILDILRENDDKRLESFRGIWERNPNFFMQSSEMFKIVIQNNFMVFTFEMHPSEVGNFIDGDFKVGKNSTFFETFLSGDTWELFDWNSWDGDWESALDYHVDQVRENVIKEYILRKSQTQGVDPETLEAMTLQDLINEYDEDDGVIDAIRMSLEECEQESYYNEVKNQLEEALSNYGDVEKMNDEGVTIKINLSEILKNNFEGDYDEILEWIEDKGFEPTDFDGIFRELMMDDPYGDKPEYSMDDRWTPDVDNANFNSVLSYRLSEFIDDDIVKKFTE
jgi:hypothetical protein